MKICPKCQKTYSDPNLNFCLDDGSVLTQSQGEAMPETVLINQARPTQASPPAPVPQAPQAAWNTAQPQQAMQPKKSSKTWIWVVLILGVLALVCGGGLIGFLAYVGSQANNVTSNSSTTSSPNPNSSNSSSSTTTTSNSGRSSLETVDLSEWVREFSLYGTTEMSGNELLMAAKQKGFYYVLAAPADTYQTEKADTRVSLRNVDNADSRLGYGIVFHSNPTPLQQGYAFLIDSKKKRYRVVHHSPQKEDTVVTWKSSNLIKDGSQSNILEVRDLTDKIELYINGEMVTSIKNQFGFAGGVVGLYAGDGAKIAFSNLELRK